jgi:hypothetical protein
MGGVKDMSWADLLIVSVTAHYLLAAAIYAWQGQVWLGWVYGAYALANFGLIALSVQVQK